MVMMLDLKYGEDYQVGYYHGYHVARDEFVFMERYKWDIIHGIWWTVETYGDYMYSKGLNEMT